MRLKASVALLFAFLSAPTRAAEADVDLACAGSLYVGPTHDDPILMQVRVRVVHSRGLISIGLMGGPLSIIKRLTQPFVLKATATSLSFDDDARGIVGNVSRTDGGGAVIMDGAMVSLDGCRPMKQLF